MLREVTRSVILDGDDLRECWELGFDYEDRWEQNLRAMSVANLLADQGVNVIVATICPYPELRRVIHAHSRHPIRFIYLPGGDPRDQPFEWGDGVI